MYRNKSKSFSSESEVSTTTMSPKSVIDDTVFIKLRKALNEQRRYMLAKKLMEQANKSKDKSSSDSVKSPSIEKHYFSSSFPLQSNSVFKKDFHSQEEEGLKWNMDADDDFIDELLRSSPSSQGTETSFLSDLEDQLPSNDMEGLFTLETTTQDHNEIFEDAEAIIKDEDCPSSQALNNLQMSSSFPELSLDEINEVLPPQLQSHYHPQFPRQYHVYSMSQYNHFGHQNYNHGGHMTCHWP